MDGGRGDLAGGRPVVRRCGSAGPGRVQCLLHGDDGRHEYGHELGDLALVAVADRLRGAVRDQDVVARLGGDEFAILTTAGDGGPAVLADRVLAALRAPLDLSGRPVTVGASIGIAGSGPGHATPGELLRNADAAMYAAKRQGRDRIVVFDPALWPDTPAVIAR
ncbi:GGDEF domain-containing protein [Actinoplanes sp. NPDC026619]|uniref:GGDEF domain-containing protein n=1 Tax=Actinoplanes sp. NPDC026619 TaxID=3155798 RepID=UPI0033F380C9